MKDIDSTKLLPWNRWDILVKYYYVYMYLIYEKNPPEWINQLYHDHILVLNGGKEERTVFQLNVKNTTTQFIKDFHELIQNIKNKV